MSTIADTRRRFRRGWEYYRRYTKRRTGVHAAATAALTGFGLLATFERWFVVVAIVAYLAPPVYLYLVGDDLADPEQSTENASGERDGSAGIGSDSDRTVRRVDIDADADSDGADADADGADADADGVDADTDTDSDDGDTDSDSDDGDTDSDSDDGDTDSDSDADG